MTDKRLRAKQIVQLLLVVATLAYAGRALAGQWEEVRAVARNIRLSWGWILLSSALVLCTHASLVQSWRMLLAGWDTTPSFWTSVRIWTVANLGRYLPGKVWSIGALSVLAAREGVSGVAAASAAILGTLLNLGAGFGIVALSGTGVLGAINPWLARVSVAASALFVVGVVLLPRLLPPIVNWIARRRGLSVVNRHISARTLWAATAVNVFSWVGYGLAFAAFSRGVTPQVAGAGVAFITVYTASYLWGYLWLFAPGGIGYREWALIAMLVALGMTAKPDAIILALASRVWITVLELTPGLVSLFFTPASSRVPVHRTD